MCLLYEWWLSPGVLTWLEGIVIEQGWSAGAGRCSRGQRRSRRGKAPCRSRCVAHRQLRGKSFCRRAGIQQCGDNFVARFVQAHHASEACMRGVILHHSQNQRTCCARPAINLPAAAVEAATTGPVSAERAALAAASNSCARCMMAPHSQSIGARDSETAITNAKSADAELQRVDIGCLQEKTDCYCQQPPTTS